MSRGSRAAARTGRVRLRDRVAADHPAGSRDSLAMLSRNVRARP